MNAGTGFADLSRSQPAAARRLFCARVFRGLDDSSPRHVRVGERGRARGRAADAQARGIAAGGELILVAALLQGDHCHRRQGEGGELILVAAKLQGGMIQI